MIYKKLKISRTLCEATLKLDLQLKAKMALLAFFKESNNNSNKHYSMIKAIPCFKVLIKYRKLVKKF